MIRHSTDRQFSLGAGCVRLDGPADSKIRLVCGGKLMRAACMLCAYTGDADLRRIVDDSAADMMGIQRPDGCLSTVPDALQPQGTHGSDLWERKYALMGLLSYYELSGSAAALDACVRLVRLYAITGLLSSCACSTLLSTRT